MRVGVLNDSAGACQPLRFGKAKDPKPPVKPEGGPNGPNLSTPNIDSFAKGKR